MSSDSSIRAKHGGKASQELTLAKWEKYFSQWKII